MTGGSERQGRGLALILAMGVLGLAALNAHLLVGEIDITPLPPGDAAATAQTTMVEGLPEDAATVGSQSYPETLRRPLFRSTRRPPEPEKPRTAAAPAPTARQVARLPENLELVGIMKESGRTERALIRSDAAQAGQWVEVGHVLQGWRLSRIESGSILFEADGRQQRLTLYRTDK
jgi:general secretion pathway protein N